LYENLKHVLLIIVVKIKAIYSHGNQAIAKMNDYNDECIEYCIGMAEQHLGEVIQKNVEHENVCLKSSVFSKQNDADTISFVVILDHAQRSGVFLAII
jgi:hypothetical protein